MAESNARCGARCIARCRAGYKFCCDCCSKLFIWAWKNVWSLNFLVLGVVGASCSMFFMEDEDWKVPVSSYFAAIAACAAVTFIVRKGNLYYRNPEHDIRDSFQACRTQRPVAQRPVAPSNPILDLLKERLRNVLPGNPYENVREPTPVPEDNSNVQPDIQPNVTVAEVHQYSEDSERILPKSTSPEEMESSLSNPVGSDPQTSTTTPDSGVTVQTSAQSPQTSGDELTSAF